MCGPARCALLDPPRAPRLSPARVPRSFGNHGNMCMSVRRGVLPQTIDTLRLHQLQSETAFFVLPYVREVGISGGAMGVQTASALWIYNVALLANLGHRPGQHQTRLDQTLLLQPCRLGPGPCCCRRWALTADAALIVNGPKMLLPRRLGLSPCSCCRRADWGCGPVEAAAQIGAGPLLL